VSILKQRTKTKIKLLMVGDGVYLNDVKFFNKKYGLEKITIFTGRVPHDDVEEYYSLVDICPFPRKGLPVCEMVSPLKPFEAMAMEKAVISSNVAALAEIVDHNVTGLLFKKDDPNDLAEQLLTLVDNKALRDEMGKAARDWVVKQHDWKIIGSIVDKVYAELLNPIQSKEKEIVVKEELVTT
jgi:glycosyltransferase involved in cell wall biosynthesis